MPNIKYQDGLVRSRIAEIRGALENQLAQKAADYDQLLTAFSISECEEATALRELISVEKENLEALVDFYTKLLAMILNASNDVKKVEDHYNQQHITKSGISMTEK